MKEELIRKIIDMVEEHAQENAEKPTPLVIERITIDSCGGAVHRMCPECNNEVFRPSGFKENGWCHNCGAYLDWENEPEDEEVLKEIKSVNNKFKVKDFGYLYCPKCNMKIDSTRWEWCPRCGIQFDWSDDND